MKLRLMIALLALVGTCSAQAPMQIESRAVAGPGRESSPPPDKKFKPTPEQMERGRQMLEAAEGQAAGLQGGMRAYALLEVSRAYQATNKKKTLQLLEDALAATRGMDDDSLHTKSKLEERILQALVPLAPQRVDELLDQVTPASRGAVLRSLLQYYQKNKDLDHALQVLYRAGADKEMPYDAAAAIMAALPPERSADLVNTFNLALLSYRNNQHTSAMMGGGDFADLITRFWRKVPKETVLEAIADVLRQAKAQVEKNSGMHISMASSKGAVEFNSYYEYRLFQLLPVLRELDESGAKKMVEDYQQVQTLLAKYPQGTGSLNSSDDPNETNFGMMSVTDGRGPLGGGGGGAGARRPQMPSPLEMQQLSKIAADAIEHPQDALADVPAIPRPELRAQAYQLIARNSWQKNASVARQSLEKLLDLVPQLELDQQLRTLGAVADTYLDMDEKDAAKKTVERGMTAADKAYERDSNADDPNKALKAYWPSAAAYRSFLRPAARISPAWATKLANEISDPEMKVLLQIAIAESWLDISPGSTTIMTSTKQGGNRMMLDIDR